MINTKFEGRMWWNGQGGDFWRGCHHWRLTFRLLPEICFLLVRFVYFLPWNLLISFLQVRICRSSHLPLRFHRRVPNPTLKNHTPLIMAMVRTSWHNPYPTHPLQETKTCHLFSRGFRDSKGKASLPRPEKPGHECLRTVATTHSRGQLAKLHARYGNRPRKNAENWPRVFVFVGFVFFKWFFTDFTMGFKSPSWRPPFGSQCFWFAFSFRIKQANPTLAGFQRVVGFDQQMDVSTIHFLDQPKNWDMFEFPRQREVSNQSFQPRTSGKKNIRSNVTRSRRSLPRRAAPWLMDVGNREPFAFNKVMGFFFGDPSSAFNFEDW